MANNERRPTSASRAKGRRTSKGRRATAARPEGAATSRSPHSSSKGGEKGIQARNALPAAPPLSPAKAQALTQAQASASTQPLLAQAKTRKTADGGGVLAVSGGGATSATQQHACQWPPPPSSYRTPTSPSPTMLQQSGGRRILAEATRKAQAVRAARTNTTAKTAKSSSSSSSNAASSNKTGTSLSQPQLKQPLTHTSTTLPLSFVQRRLNVQHSAKQPQLTTTKTKPKGDKNLINQHEAIKSQQPTTATAQTPTTTTTNNYKNTTNFGESSSISANKSTLTLNSVSSSSSLLSSSNLQSSGSNSLENIGLTQLSSSAPIYQLSSIQQNRKLSTSKPISNSPLSTTNVIDKMVDQAVIDKLEAGFAKLQAATPEQCHSLLKKYLTREVLDKCKNRKTAMGATLLDVCQSGFENLDSGVGIYAPDAESYTLFSELFNPIIEDYHGGFKATDKHPASDFGDLESLVNVDPDNQYVISTRVRCGRSLQGYPFNPCLTEAQYKEMEQKVSSTLKEVEGDLAGTYYPLTGMTKETQQQLIDDHFLFKEGDRFLQAANACRYWPTGRGIYHNAAKTFLVWVNEEDHLRIISMQKGGDLKTVFGRLVKGARAIEAKVPFSRDDRLGFLTFCPTNLGTTIRASVHIKLPKLAADRKKLEEVAGRYNLQVRGTSGEHTESVGGVYDISNKRRLGLTEYQAVREMQDGILELIKIEKSL